MADGQVNKTRERTERAATAVQAMHGDSCSADRVDPGPMCSTSSGDDCTGPLAAAPKSCLPSMEMRSPTAAGDLLPTGEASTTTNTIFNKSPLRLYLTEETNSTKTPTSYVSHDSIFFQMINLLAVPSCRRVVETKSEENRMFDPGGSRSSPRLPVLGSWRALLCGRFMLGLDETAAFFGGSMIRDSKVFRRAVRVKLFTPYV